MGGQDTSCSSIRVGLEPACRWNHYERHLTCEALEVHHGSIRYGDNDENNSHSCHT